MSNPDEELQEGIGGVAGIVDFLMRNIFGSPSAAIKETLGDSSYFERMDDYVNDKGPLDMDNMGDARGPGSAVNHEMMRETIDNLYGRDPELRDEAEFWRDEMKQRGLWDKEYEKEYIEKQGYDENFISNIEIEDLRNTGYAPGSESNAEGGLGQPPTATIQENFPGQGAVDQLLQHGLTPDLNSHGQFGSGQGDAPGIFIVPGDVGLKILPGGGGESWSDKHGDGTGGGGPGAGGATTGSSGPGSTGTGNTGTGNTGTVGTVSTGGGHISNPPGSTPTKPPQQTSPISSPPVSNPPGSTPTKPPQQTKPGLPMSPILLDLDGDGIQITEFGKSSQFMTGKDGLQHRSSWAGAGDGVLFFDPDGRNAITEARQYVFTEWNPTAAGDLEALRSVWDTNGDGKLTAADADFAKFKVMMTKRPGPWVLAARAAGGLARGQLAA